MITPLSLENLLPHSVTVTPKPPSVIEKVFLKTVSKDKVGKNLKVPILIARGLHHVMIKKNEIRTQLQGDVVLSDFVLGLLVQVVA